jgi:hypothetical protein
MELESQGTLLSLTHRKHRHKKRSKAKRSRQRKRSDKEMDVDLLARGDLPADYPGDQDTQPTESIVKDAGSAGKIELAGESKEDRAVAGGDDVTMAEADGTHSKSSPSLVPYQDSSTTETEGREQGEGAEPTRGAAASDDGNIQDDRPGGSPSDGSKERLASSTSSAGSSGALDGDREVNNAIEELEAAMKEGVAAVTDDGGDRAKSDDGDKASVKEGNVKSDDGGDDVAVDEGAPPTSAAVEGEEEEEIAEDSLMIAVHVEEDDIDQDSAELLDAECPNKGIPRP